MVADVIDGRTLDRVAAAQLAAIANAQNETDAPHNEPDSGECLRLRLKHGWDNRGTEHIVVGRDSSQVVAFTAVELPYWDNRHMAFAELYVHPGHRDSSVADEMLNQVYDLMKINERTLLIANAWRDSWLERFWRDHGFEMGSEAAQRRLTLADLDWRRLDEMHSDAVARSAAYDVFEVPRPVQDNLVDDMVQAQRAMNDAPVNDLAIDDDEWSAERYRGFEAAMANRRMTSYRLAARHRTTRAIAGFTAVVVEEERPHLGFQEDTAVVRAHRGHRLGLRLKIEMLRMLREPEPQIRQIDTWNARSNTHMVAVNEALGCFVVGHGGELQLDLASFHLVPRPS
jgi:GNAT superfamily N-acetyltransferase